ncbi:MAG TPA: trypsin-like peptidase domain-containing protein [Candidatus Paceibacterota bacterium]|nr:trypsin-like peptidase domain-containing protein [Candidatus Paceibacterota bacterium]
MDIANITTSSIVNAVTYLVANHRLPGLQILFPSQLKEYGPTIEGLGAFARPLVFDSGLAGYEYAISGTCFLASFRGRNLVITARHCLTGSDGNDVRIACNPVTKSFLPLKQMHRAEGNPDYCDFVVFEAAPELLSFEEAATIPYLNLDQLRPRTRQVRQGTKLVVPGFPKDLNAVDYGRFVLHEQRYLPSGYFLGPTSETGIYQLSFDHIEHVESIDGMSGSPVFSIEEHNDLHYFGFMGMIIRGSVESRSARFIASEIIFQALNKLFPS